MNINKNIVYIGFQINQTMPFNKLDETAIGKIKPRFKLESPEKIEKIIQLILTEAKNDNTIELNLQQGKYLRINIPEKDQHYWSPVLNLSCYDKEVTDKTVIRGQIGPSESVWGIFVLTYAALAILGFFGSVWAYVQWVLHKETIYFLIIPIATILVLSIFITSQFGQRKAHAQTLHLLRFLRKAVDSIDCVRVL